MVTRFVGLLVLVIGVWWGVATGNLALAILCGCVGAVMWALGGRLWK